MSANEDERVASLKFDNAQFDQGVKATLASLEALNKGLKLEGAAKGISDLSTAGKNFDLSHIGRAVDDIAGRFHTMSVVAITAIANVANKAVDAGQRILTSLTVDPVNKGLQEYQTNINSIQTILSNTRWQHTGLEDVNKALDTLNHYSDQTIYNFSEMARNIGTFTAAGVKLDVATNAIKGIANLAAVSGSNSQQASVAMYQLSQAIASGTVKLIDWNSVVNAGMGGKVFQDALLETARVHGVAVDSMIKADGSFRATLQRGWLSADILTETLSHFTGDLTKAQIVSMGYTNAQADAIVAMGKDAQDAATKVKTVSQLLSTLQESAGSGWAKTWQLIFGDFNEAKSLFTDVNDVLGGFIQASADSRNEILGDWKELGGRTVLIEAISAAWNDLLEILYPIHQAFRDIFPKTTGEQLYKITVAIRDFFSEARMGEDTMDNIRRTFAGFFAIFGIGWEIVKQVFRVIFDLIGTMQGGSGGILEFTGNIGDFLVAVHKAVQEGQGLTTFFNGIEAALKVPIKLVQALGVFLSSLFDDFDSEKAEKVVNNLAEKLSPFQLVAQAIEKIWNRIDYAFDQAWNTFEPLASKISAFFHEFSENVSAFAGGLGLNDMIAGVNTGLLGYLVLSLTTLFGHDGIISNARAILENVNDTLNTMQNTLRAATLLQIAIAIGILTISVSQLSKIDAAALTRSLAAITVMFGQLAASLLVLERMPATGVVKLYTITTAMVILGLAIKVLASAVEDLGSLDAKELHRGLISVVILMAAVTEAARLLPPQATLVSTGLGIIALAVGIKILASAVEDLSGLNWTEMAKGLTGVATLLGALALYSKFAAANATGVLAGAGIILLAVGIKVLASAFKDLSGISWENIGKGVATLATSLAAITAALYLIPPTAPLQATAVAIVAASLLILGKAIESISDISWENVGKGMAVLATSLALIAIALSLMPPYAPLAGAGILIVALALESIAAALKNFAGMSWKEVAKGLTVLAGSLGIIAIAMNLMLTALPGALALLIVSNSLLVLTGVLLIIADMSWGEIFKGLTGLALALGTLGLAALILSPILPALFGLGAALLLIGAGVALAGAGIFLLAAGITALSVAGAAGTAAILAFVSGVIGLIPMLVESLGIALTLIIQFLIESTPKIVELLAKLIFQLVEAVIKMTPQLTTALIALLSLAINVLVDAIPKFAEAGLKILISILESIKNNIGKVVKTAVEVVAAFLIALGKELPKIIDAGFKLIISFIDGVSKAIDDNAEELGAAGGRLGVAIIKGMVKGISGGIGEITSAAKNVAKSALNSAKDFLGIDSPSKEFEKLGKYSDMGMAQGLDKFAHLVADSSEAVGQGAIESLGKSLKDMSSLIEMNVDTTPRIVPILDLTQVEKEANRLGSLVSAQPITFDASYSNARRAAEGQAGIRGGEDTYDDSSTGGGKPIIYNQTNISPKPLSTAEIYRQTKNQLSVAKGAVTKND